MQNQQPKKIPYSANEEINVLFRDESNFKFPYSKERSRGSCARFITLWIYDYGATIINRDKIDIKELIKRSLTDFESRFDCTDMQLNINEVSPVKEIPQVEQETLLKAYHDLPQFLTFNGYKTGGNPLQAFFIFKVALDYLPPQVIYYIYKLINKNTDEMNTRILSLLPNGSRLIGNAAIEEFIYYYILFNEKLFHEAQLKKNWAHAPESCYTIFGCSYESIIPTYHQVFNYSIQDITQFIKSLMSEKVLFDSEYLKAIFSKLIEDQIKAGLLKNNATDANKLSQFGILPNNQNSTKLEDKDKIQEYKKEDNNTYSFK